MVSRSMWSVSFVFACNGRLPSWHGIRKRHYRLDVILAGRSRSCWPVATARGCAWVSDVCVCSTGHRGCFSTAKLAVPGRLLRLASSRAGCW
ncbi:uncharacterized protein LY79DRAFT_172584 [Colletotrichum navitas]|uniref:Uncharacterized protein n=1 Tax=Colletotrichum navitas TaxID=681940 RepID=A0AAD8V6S2_9PEZI|nr:uncharacterized protein LY79DRAFT_172584 [Colletotrichum navitas]KAK1593871.1 hypothetical protein LY79DRAFT_172584 [Colletotrichum navitas]